MRLITRFAMVLTVVLTPLVASAQYKDLDVAIENLNRGFGSGVELLFRRVNACANQFDVMRKMLLRSRVERGGDDMRLPFTDAQKTNRRRKRDGDPDECLSILGH